jgi:hypothetical protein
MAVFSDINQAIKKAVLDGAFVTASQVVFENNEDNSNKTQPWLAVFILPADTEQASLGGSGYGTDSHTGLIQIDVNYTSHSGTTDQLAMVDAINAHFSSGSLFAQNDTCVRIGNVSRGRVVVGQGSSTISITINYFLQSTRV